MTTEERFWSKVNITDNDKCWEWKAGANGEGYGVFYPNGAIGGPVRAHRYSYEITHGAIEPGKLILHSCDNPRCVNPHHLRQGTQSDNLMDREKRKRGNYYCSNRTACKNGHEYTSESTYITKKGTRECKICRRLCQAKSRNRKKGLL